jgi:hypothetical protein
MITLLTWIIITDTSASTVRADDPLLSMGEQTLYIPPTSISHKKKIGEGEAISRYLSYDIISCGISPKIYKSY